MSLCDCRGIFANGKEVTRRRSGAASRGSDEAIRRNDRQACRRINQRFLKAPRQIVMSAFFILHAICAWSLRNLPGLPEKIP